MKRKTYLRVLAAVLVICILLTVAHFVYAAYAYEHASVVYFIAKELW